MEAEEIREFRKRKGLSQEGLARILHVSAMTVHRWEKNRTRPSPLAKERLQGLVNS